MNILWKDNHFLCQILQKISCSLYMKKRLLILGAIGNTMKKKAKSIIIMNCTVYVDTKPNFHRYTICNFSADEGQNSIERNTRTTVTSPLYSRNFNWNLNICTSIGTTTFDSNLQNRALISMLVTQDSIVKKIADKSIVMDM